MKNIKIIEKFGDMPNSHKKEKEKIVITTKGLITLLIVSNKILYNCIQARTKGNSEEIIGDYEGYFRLKRATTIQLFILR